MSQFRQIIKGYWSNCAGVDDLPNGSRQVEFNHQLDTRDLVMRLKAGQIAYDKPSECCVIISKGPHLNTEA